MLEPDYFSREALLRDEGECVSAGATEEIRRQWEEKRAKQERLAVVKGLIAEYESQIARLQTELSELTRNAPDATAA
jgi:hypothetical protein